MTDETDIKTKLDTTQEQLSQATAYIKSVRQRIKNAKAEMEKAKWRQGQETRELQEMENELSIVLDDMKQLSEAKAELHQRMETFYKLDTTKFNPEEEDQKLFDEITAQLNTKVNDKG